jgi:hypothetical protein
VVVRIAPEVFGRLGEHRRASLVAAAGVVQAEAVTLVTCGPFAWAELVPRHRPGTVVRLAAWGAADLLAFTDPRAADAVVAEAQPELPADVDAIVTVLGLCGLPALASLDDVAPFYDRAKRRVLATPRLRDEFEPPHIDTAGFVFLSHRRRRGDIVRVVVDVRSFSMSCDVLGTAGEVIPTLRVGNQTT